jgi:hypothetical protein
MRERVKNAGSNDQFYLGMVAFRASKLGKVALIVSHTEDTTTAGRGALASQK